MISNWTDMIDTALLSLPPLHRDILRLTLELPGEQKHIFYTEALRLWNLDRHQFDVEREAALDGFRQTLIRHGITRIDDLMFVQSR